MHGRIHVREIPFVSGNLPIRLHVPFPRQQIELLFCKSGINDSERYAMESGIPSSEKWIFPPVKVQLSRSSDKRHKKCALVGHGKNIVNVHVRPILAGG